MTIRATIAACTANRSRSDLLKEDKEIKELKVIKENKELKVIKEIKELKVLKEINVEVFIPLNHLNFLNHLKFLIHLLPSSPTFSHLNSPSSH